MNKEHGSRRASRYVVLAAVLGGTGVLLGAFGAHALEPRLEAAGTTDVWETAVRYQVWHALALLAIAGLDPGPSARWLPGLFGVGALLFAGSLYGLALGGPKTVLGPITPLGGVLLASAWITTGVLGATGRMPQSRIKAHEFPDLS